MSEEKSYLGLILWLIGFLAVMTLCLFLPEAWMLRGIMQLCSLGILVLIYMIWVNEKIYWINGVTFEEALQATSAQRKAFAGAHLKLFGWFAAAFLVFSAVSVALGWSEWWDFAVGTVGMIAVAVATVPIKLQTKKDG